VSDPDEPDESTADEPPIRTQDEFDRAWVKMEDEWGPDECP